MRAGFPSCLFLTVVALSRRRYLARQTTGMRRKEGIRGLTGSRTAALGQDCGACRAEDAAALRGGGVRRVGVPTATCAGRRRRENIIPHRKLEGASATSRELSHACVASLVPHRKPAGAPAGRGGIKEDYGESPSMTQGTMKHQDKRVSPNAAQLENKSASLRTSSNALFPDIFSGIEYSGL